MKIIPYGKQFVNQEDIDNVITALKSDFLTQGPLIEQFENDFANYIGSEFSVAVANGTAALHLSAIALGIKPGDKVITTPITFAASANCVRFCGGEIVFADIDPKTYLLDINEVRKLLESSPKGTYKGIIPVDFAGGAVNLEAFRELANQFDCWIIEDSCHSPGGFFMDSNEVKQQCGNGNFADLAIFSFHPVKHIASGEGGMITTNSKTLYEKLLMLRTHGITRNLAGFQNSIAFANGIAEATDYPGWYMEMQTLGYNYRLTEFQAAFGLSQLKRAEKGITRRREIASIYKQAFASIPQITDRNTPPLIHDLSHRAANNSLNYGHAHHLYVIEVENRLGLYNYLRENQIYSQVHYIPTHLMPYYRQFGWKEGDLPKAESYYRKCISLPMYPSINSVELNYVIEKIKSFYNK